MNDLVIVRTNIHNTKKRKFKPKNIQVYINDLLNTEKYVLDIFNYRYIEIFQLVRGYKKFFGSIYKEKNKKRIYDLIETHIRIIDE
jgi:hypothetical protein